ncbi:hypothetical protein AVEN_224634-1 [Araneus ventricosus]|uniref:Reverse transcriptase domain-containing protein n=1 Tax=Araneus ventricosus TaxID=182803 RepID=A0A4Y2QXJ0_ARAVE|nr:hypothetical protein AVEN_224634-1 [Araneus ventricosus]
MILEAVAVQVHTRSLITVCSIYLTPHDVISQQELNNLVDQPPTPFILLGDFIGRSTLWGSDSTNFRGQQIEQFTSDNCLCLLNDDETTYFHEPTRTFHSLDLAICSPELLPLLNFSVGSDLYNSDHFPLIVSHVDSGGAILCPPRFLFQRADWFVFSQLADITETMVSTADISEQHIVNAITNAANNNIPKTLPRLRKFRKPWWNAACRDSRRREKILWNRFRRYPTTENLVAFKQAKALARRIRRRSQRESWINFISSIISSTSTEGVPQGIALSVTLFILHLSQILSHLPSSVHGSLYIDDLQISCQGSNMHLIERQLQNAVNKLVAWCDNNGHTISAEKSRCVHFSRKRNINLDPNIRIRNSPILVVNEIRFLGVNSPSFRMFYTCGRSVRSLETS